METAQNSRLGCLPDSDTCSCGIQIGDITIPAMRWECPLKPAARRELPELPVSKGMITHSLKTIEDFAWQNCLQEEIHCFYSTSHAADILTNHPHGVEKNSRKAQYGLPAAASRPTMA
ncbi:hypothetical protein GDO78_013373 [Eleutherodactylus coqui]|uniref:Uncharacterized protein n=1 Tax=Eleutherodactylus coqui TaxID=57060 RepID=A0A8J6K4D8_ELECQ|nr:hypothetical protein GDO78_013373 [Eleutherodactylus coqui]